MCCAFRVQAEEGSDEVYCQVLLVPENEVRLIHTFHFGSAPFLESSLNKERDPNPNSESCALRHLSLRG